MTAARGDLPRPGNPERPAGAVPPPADATVRLSRTYTAYWKGECPGPAGGSLFAIDRTS